MSILPPSAEGGRGWQWQHQDSCSHASRAASWRASRRATAPRRAATHQTAALRAPRSPSKPSLYGRVCSNQFLVTGTHRRCCSLEPMRRFLITVKVYTKQSRLGHQCYHSDPSHAINALPLLHLLHPGPVAGIHGRPAPHMPTQSTAASAGACCTLTGPRGHTCTHPAVAPTCSPEWRRPTLEARRLG